MSRERDEVRQELEAAMTEIEKRSVKVTAKLRREDAPLSADSEEAAIEVENDEVLESLDEASRIRLQQIRAALARLDDGTYGTCVRCGDSIEDNRLVAMPETPTCVTCASELEKAG